MFEKILQNAMQKHHDYYVRVSREGRLPPESQPQYDLAMKREREGVVKPLDEHDEIDVAFGGSCRLVTSAFGSIITVEPETP